MVNVIPAELADVYQAVDAANVHERAEVEDLADNAFHDLPHLHALEQLLARLFLFPFQHGATAEHQVLALGVHFGDHAQQLLLEKLGVILHAKHGDLARRNETANGCPPCTRDRPCSPR